MTVLHHTVTYVHMCVYVWYMYMCTHLRLEPSFSDNSGMPSDAKPGAAAIAATTLASSNSRVTVG